MRKEKKMSTFFDFMLLSIWIEEVLKKKKK